MKPITLEIKVVDDLIKAGDFFFYPPSKEWLKAVSISDQYRDWETRNKIGRAHV